MRFIYLILLSIFLLSTAPASAVADDALLNATSYEKFDRNTPMTVRTLDNSDTNIAIQGIIENTLRKLGYNIIDNAGLIVTFDTRNESGAWSNTESQKLLELRNQGGTPYSNNPEVAVNLYNSSRGGVLNPGRPGTTQVTPSMLRLDVTVENSANGQRLWEGWSQTNLGLADELTLSKAMVPILLNNLGNTVRQKKISLY